MKRTLYDRIAPFYDLLSSRPERRFRNLGIDMLDIGGDDRVLEIGCGTGEALLRMAEKTGPNGSVTGLDLSGPMLAVAERKIRKKDPAGRIRLVRSSALRMPFRKGAFQKAFLSFTLELFSDRDIQGLLGQIRRVLSRGGKLCVVSLAENRNPGWIARIYGFLHRKLPRVIDCRPIPLRDILKKAGFRIIRYRSGNLYGLPVGIALVRTA